MNEFLYILVLEQHHTYVYRKCIFLVWREPRQAVPIPVNWAHGIYRTALMYNIMTVYRLRTWRGLRVITQNVKQDFTITGIFYTYIVYYSHVFSALFTLSYTSRISFHTIWMIWQKIHTLSRSYFKYILSLEHICRFA